MIKRDKTKRDPWLCSKLYKAISGGDLRDNHPQQRRAGQWKNEDRDNFIVTVILNEDFDAIKICEQTINGNTVLWIIDGIQKSYTIKNYKEGKFRLGRKIDPHIIEWEETKKDENGNPVFDEDGNMIYEKIAFDLRNKSYEDLPEKLKDDFDNCPISVVKHLDCTDKEISRHICRYNSGKPMVTAQKIVTYMDKTAKFIKKISGHAFFNDCANFSEAADKNGTVDRTVCEAIMALNYFDIWTPKAEKIGKYINENATEEMFNKFIKQLDRLLDIITPETGKLFTQKNAILWFILFNEFSKLNIDDMKFKEFIENFTAVKNNKVKVYQKYELIKGSEDYTSELSFSEIDACATHKEKNTLIDKLHILKTYMCEYLNISMDDLNKLNNSSSNEDIENDSCKNNESTNNENTDEEIITDNVVIIDNEDNSNAISDDDNEVNVDTETNEEEKEPTDVIDFVKENVNPNVTEDDIDIYYEMLDSYKINKHSPLLHWKNEPSLIALIAYSYLKDIDLDNWIIEYFNKNDDYISDQKENYLHMQEDLNKYISDNKAA